MNTKIISTAVLVSALLVPAVSFAATYQYVTTSGTLQSVNADNSTQAIAIAPNIAPHSGVILVSGTSGVPVTTGTGPYTYQFVRTDGTLGTVNASNPTQAMALAVNIAPHSGVILLGNAQ